MADDGVGQQLRPRGRRFVGCGGAVKHVETQRLPDAAQILDCRRAGQGITSLCTDRRLRVAQPLGDQHVVHTARGDRVAEHRTPDAEQ